MEKASGAMKIWSTASTNAGVRESRVAQGFQESALCLVSLASVLDHRREVTDQKGSVVPEKASELFSESRPSILDANWHSEQLCSWRCNMVWARAYLTCKRRSSSPASLLIGLDLENAARRSFQVSNALSHSARSLSCSVHTAASTENWVFISSPFCCIRAFCSPTTVTHEF